jgi:hypothetical protein
VLHRARRFVTLGLVLRAIIAWWAVVLCVSSAQAFTLRVVAPTELQVSPTVRADRTGVRLSLTLRDDKGAPVAGTVRVDASSGAISTQRAVAVDVMGRGVVDLPVPRGERVIDVRAQYAGDDIHAAAIAQLRVDLDAPFVSVSLMAPVTVDLDARTSVEFVATVSIGAVALVSPRGWPVHFYVDGDRVGVAQADATGRARLRLDSSRFTTPGVKVLRAAVLLRGSEIWSVERRMIARALTSVVVTPVRDDRSGQLRLQGAVAWRGGGVAGASVRVESGRVRVATGTTDRSGTFDIRVSPRFVVAGARARVVFVPTTPWLSGAESAEFFLGLPQPTPIHWRWALAPCVIGAVAVLVLRRTRAQTTLASSIVLDEGATLELVEASSDSTLSVIVEDRSSGALLDGAEVSIDGTPLAQGSVRSAPLGALLTVEVRCERYAPRTLSVRVDRGGALLLRVQLASWREALFDVARPHLPSPSGAKVSPTLSEARNAHPAGVRKLFDEVERGAYGPDEPDASTVARARAAASAFREGEH